MSADPKERRPWYERHLWHLQPVRDLGLIALVVGLFLLGERLSIVTVPLLLGLGLAYALEPFIRWAGRAVPGFTRNRVIVTTCGSLLLALALLLLLLVPVLISQASALVANRGRYAQAVEGWAQRTELPTQVQDAIFTITDAVAPGERAEGSPVAELEGAALDETVSAHVQRQWSAAEIRSLVVEEELEADAGSDDGSALGRQLARIGKVLGQAVGSIFAFGTFLFLVVFFFVVFSSGFPAVKTELASFIPSRNRERWLGLLRDMDAAISGFIRGRLSIAVISGVVYAVGWTICGVPFAILLGLGVGLISIIPYAAGLGLVGAYALLAADILGQNDPQSSWYLASEGGEVVRLWWAVLLFPGIVFMLVQLLDDYVLTPLIQGPATKLSTPTIIAAVIAGGSLGGLFGMLLAIPVAACLRILIKDVWMPQIRSWLDGTSKDPLPLDQDEDPATPEERTSPN